MTRWPTCWVSQVCSTPRPPVITTTDAITAASVHRSGRFGPPSTKRAESNTVLIKTGLTTPKPAVTNISDPMARTRGQWGRNASTILRLRCATRDLGRARS